MGSGSVNERSLTLFEMTDPLLCCHSERERGIFPDMIRKELKLNHYQAMTERWVHCFISVMLFTLISHGYAAGQDDPTLAVQVVGNQFLYTVASGDSLTSIGARFGVGAAVLAAQNNFSPDRLLLMSSLLRDYLLVCERRASPSDRGQWFSALPATTPSSPWVEMPSGGA